MDKVTADMIPGSRAMVSLLDMAREAMRRLDLRTGSDTASSEMLGFLVPEAGMYIAVEFANPGVLRAHAGGVDVAAARELAGERNKSGLWVCPVSLEEFGFFERAKDEQLDYLTEELEERLEVVRATRLTT